MTENQLYQKLIKLYATYTPKTITPVLYQYMGDRKKVPINYGNQGRIVNLRSLIVDWHMVGRVASKGLRNSKKRKLRKIVEGKYRKALKVLNAQNH